MEALGLNKSRSKRDVHLVQLEAQLLLQFAESFSHQRAERTHVGGVERHLSRAALRHTFGWLVGH